MKEIKRALRCVRLTNTYLALTLINLALCAAVATADFMAGAYYAGCCFAVSCICAFVAAWAVCKSGIDVHIIDVSVGDRKPRNIDRFDNWKDAMRAFYEENRNTEVPSDGGVSAAFLGWLFDGLDPVQEVESK